MNSVQESEELYKWLASKLDGRSIPSDLRTRSAAACLDLTMEHQVAITILMKHEIYGSAFALARCIFESFIRGAWLSNCANEKQVEDYSNDRLELKFYELIYELETTDGYSDGALTKVKKASWKYLNSLTHGGAHQTVRRNTNDFIEPDYEPEVIEEIIWFGNCISILAGLEAINLSQETSDEDRQEFLDKMISVTGNT